MTMAMNFASTQTFAPAQSGAMMVLPPLADPSSADEVNHRVANSLQLIAAMIAVEARGVSDPDARTTLDMTQHRIAAIAGVHRQLYQARVAGRVDLKTYLDDLARDLEQGCAHSFAGRRIMVRATTVIVTAEEATSIGIIVSELVSNACKYAYATDEAGDIRIALERRIAGGYVLVVEDDGRGIPAGGAPAGSGLGARLVGMMAARIGGDPVWQDSQPGTRFSLHVGA